MSRFATTILRTRRFAATAILGLLLVPALAAATPCTVPNTGGGTVHMPPPGCPYVSPTDFHMITNGLPLGTTVEIGVEHERFFNIVRDTGGTFVGGEKENFASNLRLNLHGTGGLSGYNRLIFMGAQCETHVAPRTPGDPVQSFDTDMFRLQGQLPPGDPDFDLLRITAGSGFGMPSPGHTTLTLMPGASQWNIDSFFDITYRIDFIGHSGGPFGGMSGSTTGTIRMGNGEPYTPPPPCVVAGNGAGSVDLPPVGCGYVSPNDLHKIIDGLPPGTTINVGAQHQEFFNVIRGPGGTLGGEREEFDSFLILKLAGTGGLTGYQRSLQMRPHCETHTGPRTPGNPVQSFDTDMFQLQGQIPPGDPDFDLLRITAGTGFGMPSPGHTTLTRAPGTPGWNVDSFFDITYRIDFVGAPGGPLAGRSGSTTGTIRMQAGQPTLTSVPGNRPLPRTLPMTNRPNPFGRGTTIEYRLPSAAHVDLTVYDAAGQLVRRLEDGVVPAGPHAMMWDGHNEDGRRMNSGTYFIKLSLNGKLVATKKATLIR